VLLAIVLAGQFMTALDVNIANVAAPSIQANLHASGAGLQLVIAGYTIAYAMLLITGARLGDIVGHRDVYLGGVTLFTVASLACGLTGSTNQLIVFRCIQGVGAALLVPQVMSLIQRNFTGQARERALSAYAGVMAGGTIFGQIIGGALISADVYGSTWRPVFLVNVPIGVVLVILGCLRLPRDDGAAGRRIDLAGLVTLSVAVVMFVIPLVLGHEEHWPVWGWLMLAGSVVVFAAFVAVQRKVAAPLIPARVLSASGMRPALAGNFVVMASFGGFLFALSLHLQSGLGDSPWGSGVRFIPAAVGFAAGAMAWRALPARLQRPMVLVEFTIGAFGLILTSEYVSGGAVLEVSLFVVGLGIGAAFSTLTTLAVVRVAGEDAADASGMLASITPIGQVFGVATFGTLFLTLLPASGHAMAVTSRTLAVASLIGACCAVPLWWQRMRGEIARMVLLISAVTAATLAVPVFVGYLQAQVDRRVPVSGGAPVRPSAPVPSVPRHSTSRVPHATPHRTRSVRHHRRRSPRTSRTHRVKASDRP
jgi:MFS family permease